MSATISRPASTTRHAEGLALVGFGGLVLSIDIPLIRLSESSFWTVLFVRGLLTALAAVVIWLVERRINGTRRPLLHGLKGIGISAIYALAGLTFIVAIFTTTAANAIFILAFNPMFAALLSWAVLGERPRAPTLLAIAATLVGVFLIIGAGLSSGNYLGDLAALATAFLIALALTVTRKTGLDSRYASALGAIAPCIIAAPFIATEGVQSGAIGWLVFNGAIVIPAATICLALGPSYVTAPETAMAYLLETVFAPIWVWMIFTEAPSGLALVGGVIVIVALVAHSIWELVSSRRRRRKVIAPVR